MARKAGNGLIVAGSVVCVIGVCIVLIHYLSVPEYWVPLMVGLGLLLLGLIRRALSRESGGDS